jgi:hypothetical protein
MVVNSNELQPTCVLPTAWRFTQMYPQYTQIQLNIISVLLFWDVLWIINDLLAPLSLFFHEFQQNSQVFTDNIKRSRSTQIYNKISPFKSLIYKNYFYIFTNILILKTILVFLSLCSWFKAIAMWASGMSNHRKKGAYWSFPVFIYIFIHIKKEKKQ